MLVRVCDFKFKLDPGPDAAGQARPMVAGLVRRVSGHRQSVHRVTEERLQSEYIYNPNS